jgi:ribose transport system permease protein
MNREPAVALQTRHTAWRRLRPLRFGVLREYGIVVSFVALFVVLSVASSHFLTWTNLENILAQQSPILIAAAAGTLVIIAGGFDLSVGAMFALTGIVAAKVAIEIDPIVGIIVGVAAGAGLGALNGAVTTAGRVNSLIGTLATSFIIRGLAVVITGGLLVTVDDPGFAALGQNEVGGVQASIVVMAVFVLVLGFVLGRTAYGRRIFAVGGNPEAARLAGIRVQWIKASTFVLSGLAAGLGGAILASRVATGQADAAVGLEFTVIAGIVVGGTSIQGGEGAIWRSVVGVLFIALINNGFTLLGLDPIYQQIVTGAIILGAVAVDAWSRTARRAGA